jgi:subtilisin family serine protease
MKKTIAILTIGMLVIVGYGNTVFGKEEAPSLLMKKEINDNNGLLKNSFIPNDPFFNQQWMLQNTGQTGGTPDADIDAPEAWDIKTGSAEVIIAIVDSGIDFTHPDLVDNIWTNLDEVPDNDVDDDNNGYIDDVHGYDFYHEDTSNLPMDTMGHGTSMAGVLAAITDNGIGLAGVAFDCKIMPVKIFNKNAVTTVSITAEGIRYAVDNGAKVICLAIGFPASSATLRDAVDYAYGKGVFICAAAGNFGNTMKTYPAAFTNVTAVAATDHNDRRMEYYYEYNDVWTNSTYGDWVDIAAPGENIITTLPTYYVNYMNGVWGFSLNYATGSGTTLATPIIGGVAALVLSKNPSYSPGKVAAILKANSDPYDSPYYLGMGRVNAYKALIELNAEPEKPAAPEGTTSGKVGEYYDYMVSTVDVDGDQIYYLFDWGDGTDSGWVGPYDSNDVCTVSYNWSEKGNYEIKVKAKDIFGLESDWSNPLPIKMPYSYTKPIPPFMELLFQRLPHAFPILRHLFGY